MSPGQTAVSLASSYLESNNNPTKATLPRLPKGSCLSPLLTSSLSIQEKEGEERVQKSATKFSPAGEEAMRRLSQGVLRNQKACNGEIST